ncbi:hypothetical protein BDQ94DRAFT_134179 [Aspergillus welwitschiae]|uniref:Uncharacterized protein n=1 Tax=Aspergillus welwitschiae TaxID=1341132 RepID=A0A3F3QHC2_9EURO|nr:hypothetical protein BDQ94DRAFT_134179 [Aspergillus welwitschiae]RDH38571.1 hypothetical protein BDQ94DRAFT_134179 [Aspergillus welwitschiae]
MLHCYLPKESPTLRESMMGKIKEKRKRKRKKRGVLPACSQHCFRACAYLTITYISSSLTAHNSS